MDNATYFENNLNQIDERQDERVETQEEVVIEDISIFDEKSQNTTDLDNSPEESSPQLFSDEGTINTSSEDNKDEVLKEEEEFEIPAFLRNQKF